MVRPTHTDADGRFRLTGVGRQRVVDLILEGDAIEQTLAIVFTTDTPGYQPVTLPGDGNLTLKIQPPRFETAVAPGRTIRGTIRDRDTGEPITGARIMTWSEGSRPLTSDAQGRFQLASQPRGRENFLTITVEDRPYIKLVKAIEGTAGRGPVDVTLKRGVWIEGKVVNQATGKPVKAVLTYYPFRDNPQVKDCPDASFLNNNVSDEVEVRHRQAGTLPRRGAARRRHPGRAG